jgi:hypothetical protein
MLLEIGIHLSGMKRRISPVPCVRLVSAEVIFELLSKLRSSASKFLKACLGSIKRLRKYWNGKFCRKSSLVGLENREYGRRDPLPSVATRHLYPQKFALTSPTSGGRSVGIVRSRTHSTEFRAVSLARSLSPTPCSSLSIKLPERENRTAHILEATTRSS